MGLDLQNVQGPPTGARRRIIRSFCRTADADWGYAYNVRNDLYNPTLDIRSTYRPTTYLQLSFLELLHIRGTVRQ